MTLENYIVRRILNDEDLSRINAIKNAIVNWQDGLKTTNGMTHNMKKNKESSNPEISKIIMSAIDKDELFFDYVAPRHSGNVILSKMGKDCYYKPHHDSPINGDFSTTIFLNNGNEYEGGELCLLHGNSEERIKLDAGSAVTYKTGTFHRVNKVTSGERIVAVFWTKTYIRDDFVRDIFYKASRIKNITKLKYQDDEYPEDLSSCLDNPHFLSQSITDSIIRYYYQ